MGGFFGVVSKHDAISDVFFGTDYHSHLGTRRGGIAAYDSEIGLQRDIHNIQNSPFRTKFEDVFDEMKGNSAIGCISDFDPQPLLIRSHLGTYAICNVGVINNYEELIDKHLKHSYGHFDSMTGGRVNTTELVAALIDTQSSFVEGIKFAQSIIDGTQCILILCEDGSIYTGCNVENASYGATNCAERTAVFKAVSEGKRRFTAIAICGGKDGVITGQFPPCGVCRQVMREFCADDFAIYMIGPEGYDTATLGELLPHSFCAQEHMT